METRVVLPYLAALGVQAHEIRAQRTFSLRLGRGMIHNVGGPDVRTGRLDYLVVRGDGRPLFVVEAKGPGITLTDDDRDQGVSYARLTDPMAPLVLVTNGTEARLFDTVTRELLTDAGDAALVRGQGRLTDDESVRVRAEALAHFVGYSAAHVAGFSRAQRGERMAPLRGDAGLHTRKYETDLYLPREHVRRAFDTFLEADDPRRVVFARGGRSGFGKTNEMCALAEACGDTHVTLFFSGAALADPLARTLADEFDWHFSEALPLPQICRRLATLADQTGRPVLIFVDAVDEASDPTMPGQLAQLASRLAAFQGRIRLVVSAKPDTWPRFMTTRGDPSPLHDRVYVPGALAAVAAVPNGQTSDDAASTEEAPFSVAVGQFTPAERDAAIARYSTAFGLAGSWPRAVRELACDPFMLRMTAEVASETGAVPADPGERDLVARYVDRKLRRTDDAERARRELVAVAQAIAAHPAAGAGAEGDGPDTPHSASWASRHAGEVPADEEDGGAGWGGVSESAVRAIAGLPTTAAIADELVAFGVLVRSRDRDGTARLAFAYERVRDYVLATYAFRLPQLGRAPFRAAALACLGHDAGAAALAWYLPYTTDAQWDGFVEAATARVERLVTAYEALRGHVAPAMRAALDPVTYARDPGPIGAAFSGGRHGSFALGFFRRESDAFPRACHDPAVGDFGDRMPGLIPTRLMGARRGRGGFWFLRDPELYAAAYFAEELRRVVKEGRLVEEDEGLVTERVLAFAIHLAPTLGLKPVASRPGERAADRLVGTELMPLDFSDLRRRVQVELAQQSYRDAHMDAQIEKERQRLLAAGVPLGIYGASSNWTAADLREWRERAVREVNAGGDFTDAARATPDLLALARTLRALPQRTTRLEHPLLPPPDLPGAGWWDGGDEEDGYSDAQLTRLVETVFERAHAAYDRVLTDSLSAPVRALLRHPPPLLGVLCTRTPPAERVHTRLAVNVTYGAATPVDPGRFGGRRAIVATLGPGSGVRVEPEPDGGGGWS